MKKICFPRIRKGYGKLVSVLRRRGGRKRTEQLPAMLLEAERCEDEQLAVMQCEDERREVRGRLPSVDAGQGMGAFSSGHRTEGDDGRFGLRAGGSAQEGGTT